MISTIQNPTQSNHGCGGNEPGARMFLRHALAFHCRRN